MTDTYRYAVALTGYEGWGTSSAIGDGISRPLYSLVSRHRTMREAEAEARRLTSAAGRPAPGREVPTYEAMRYRADHYTVEPVGSLTPGGTRGPRSRMMT